MLNDKLTEKVLRFGNKAGASRARAKVSRRCGDG